MVTNTSSGRPMCNSCSKPSRICLCTRIKTPSLNNSVAVTILQHSLELNHPLNSTRIATLGLKNLSVVSVSDVNFEAQFAIRPLNANSEMGSHVSEVRTNGLCFDYQETQNGGGYSSQVGPGLITFTIRKSGAVSSFKHHCMPQSQLENANFDQFFTSSVVLDALSNGFVVKKWQNKQLGSGCIKTEEMEEFGIRVPPGSALLFPSEDSVLIEDIGFEVKNLIVLDGTWAKAKRVYNENPWLKALPHLKLDLDKMSLYGEVRTQPRAGCLSTIESIVHALKAVGDETETDGLDNLLDVFESMVMSVKVIRNKLTAQPEGYGFIEFTSRAAAESILQTYNGALMPNTEQSFRMNWATLGAGERRADDTPDYTVFVGDLAADVSDYLLQETFKVNYPSVKGAKVVTDRMTGRSKGYGFVRFGDESEQLRAMAEMNGVLCSTRPMRVGAAATKKPVGSQQYQKATFSPQASQGETDPTNTTIFVGGLNDSVSDDHLRQVFGQFGELVHVKIPAGKHCGFVQFADRACAEQALSTLNGTQLGGQNIRLSWGRTPSSKQAQPDQSQWNGANYGYAQGYEAYGYAPPPQDPNMYYGAYPGYGNYQQPQQLLLLECLFLCKVYGNPTYSLGAFRL
ncbi:hypothetical protein RHSIM_Rhsim06G0216400 [Rhododendron simsii]|uniref:tRNA-uridine aminocarboxypropyltransferase n=1 Tax=Rhododendron simsii TaxID=118357 RepID=A0A834GVC0_RHOSS|nr:hypothetical protein RHSIM_Rhsim06G0216400 [Rhododendron simsii]